MKTSRLSLLSHLFLATSLLAGLFISSPAAALKPAGIIGSPDLPASAGMQPAAASLSLLTIPAVAVGAGSPKANGACDKTEYAGGLMETFTDGPAGTGSGSLYLLHDANYLYMCIISPMGTFATRFDSLYLDPQGDGASTTYAQQGDFSLRLDFTGGIKTMRGNGLVNGWHDTSAADNSLWSGAATTGNLDVAEYALPLANFHINVCSSIFRLAGYHHWFATNGNDYGWPTAQYFDQPGTWQPMQLGSPNCSQAGKIAYVYRSNSDAATNFNSLLTAAGYTVTLVPLGSVTTTDFSQFDLTIIADDTGSLDAWGTPPAATTAAAQVAKIIAPKKPILGLGEGGYAFFGRLSLFIGWPQGWHGPQNFLTRAAGLPPAMLAKLFNGVGPDPLQYYTVPTNNVGIYIKPSYPSDVTPVAMEVPADDHASLIQQDCRMLWGNSGIPAGMTASPAGILLFLNTVGYTRGQTCTAPTQPPPGCSYTLVKTAVPASGGTVAPGASITYTLSYHFNSTCASTGKLVDVVPFGAVFVPGSASDGISPGPDGALTWTVSPSTGNLTKTFSVQVTDTSCTANQVVTNMAELRPSGIPPISSNSTTHLVSCPPFGLPNDQPVFAEEELKAEPYPFFAGTPTQLSLRVNNLTGASLPVTVTFQVAPSTTPLGTGLVYSTVATTSASLPGHGTAVLSTTYLSTVSGNRCIKALVSTPTVPNPVVTFSCLDLNENFQAGHTELVPFVVRNDSASAKTYTLVVDNTCPGWTASVSPTSTSSLAPGSSQTVTLSVTPPNPLTLGSGCHIDLQVWNGTTLVGGMRKLDMPPVHLPVNVIPPWEEQEISFNPDPPVAGVPGQICIQLQNPLSVAKVVTVNFSVADFGAGIGMTPTVSLTDITLPRNSLHTYCANWTPAVGGTLHRCVFATLVQAGALNQISQHNVDIVRPSSRDLSTLIIPFIVGNPGLSPRGLSFDIHLVGIDPLWVPTILTPGGGPYPTMLAGGGQASLVLRFGLGAPALLPLAPQLPSNSYFGNRSRVEITELLDGIPESGFSVSLITNSLYLPLIMR